MTRKWNHILTIPQTLVKVGDWLGIYLNSQSQQPKYIVQASERFIPRMESSLCWTLLAAPYYTVNPHSASLNKMAYEYKLRGARWDQSGEDLVNMISGFVRRVRVIKLTRGLRKLNTFLFYGSCDQLEWDPDRYK